MSWIGKYLADKPPEQNGQEIVDKLCDRVVNSTLLEDRRAAVLGLKGLSRQYQLEVGTKAMPILLHVLKQDRMDPELTKAILDTLINVCGRNQGDPNDEANLGLQFTEIFVKDTQNVSLLLTVLGETDFHVRYNAIECLKILLANKRKALQDCILTSPMGVSRLMDLLSDPREVVRNEGLLLLIDLTKENADIQKIIAFENAFERLLQIVYDEDACDGDLIVEDCFHLIYNLLNDNVSNQNYFRESGLMLRFPPFFKQVTSDDPSHFFLRSAEQASWNGQRVKNVDAALSVIRIFVQPGNPNSPNNQKIIQQSQLLHTILQMALLQTSPAVVRFKCLLAVADIVHGNRTVQDEISRSVVYAKDAATAPDSPRQTPKPLLLQVISTALENSVLGTKSFEFQERCAAGRLVCSYLEGNPEAQVFFLSTMSAPPGVNPNDDGADIPVSVGNLLQTALFDWDISRKDPYRSWFASVILCHALGSNIKAKEIALNTKLGEDEHVLDLLTTVSHALMVASREDADVRVLICFLTFLSTWLHGFPKAVGKYLAEGANFSFLLEQMSATSSVDPTIQGLAAFLLGICFEFNDDSNPSLNRNAIQSILINRLGADQYINRLNRLRESRHLAYCSYEDIQDTGDSKSLPDLFFDPAFVDLFKSTYESLQKTVVSPKALKQKQQEKEDSKQQETVISSYKDVIATQDREISLLKQRVQQLESELAQGAKPSAPEAPIANGHGHGEEQEKQIASLQSQVAHYQAEAASWKQKYETAHQEMEDLLVCLAEQDMEVIKLKDRLRAHGEVITDEDEGSPVQESQGPIDDLI